MLRYFVANIRVLCYNGETELAFGLAVLPLETLKFYGVKTLKSQTHLLFTSNKLKFTTVQHSNEH